MRAGIFDGMEAVLQTNESDPKTSGFNSSAIPRSQASGFGHITPSVHGPR
jgi:hypothetical protein